MPLPGSPVLDAGSDGAAAAAGLTTDQRGAARVLDAADADTTATVDIGAVEADPIVAVIPAAVTDEDTPLQIAFNVGDAATAFDAIAATSNNQALLPDLNLAVTGSGGIRTLTLTPAPNAFGAATVTVTASRILDGVTVSSSTTFTLTVNPSTIRELLDPIGNPAGFPRTRRSRRSR